MYGDLTLSVNEQMFIAKPCARCCGCWKGEFDPLALLLQSFDRILTSLFHTPFSSPSHSFNSNNNGKKLYNVLLVSPCTSNFCKYKGRHTNFTSPYSAHLAITEFINPVEGAQVDECYFTTKPEDCNSTVHDDFRWLGGLAEKAYFCHNP